MYVKNHYCAKICFLMLNVFFFFSVVYCQLFTAENVKCICVGCIYTCYYGIAIVYVVFQNNKKTQY